jgi:hypothetical protein
MEDRKYKIINADTVAVHKVSTPAWDNPQVAEMYETGSRSVPPLPPFSPGEDMDMGSDEFWEDLPQELKDAVRDSIISELDGKALHEDTLDWNFLEEKAKEDRLRVKAQKRLDYMARTAVSNTLDKMADFVGKVRGEISGLSEKVAPPFTTPPLNPVDLLKSLKSGKGIEIFRRKS